MAGWAVSEGVTALHERWDGSELVDLDGVGHSGIASAPALLAREIRAFT